MDDFWAKGGGKKGQGLPAREKGKVEANLQPWEFVGDDDCSGREKKAVSLGKGKIRLPIKASFKRKETKQRGAPFGREAAIILFAGKKRKGPEGGWGEEKILRDLGVKTHSGG